MENIEKLYQENKTDEVIKIIKSNNQVSNIILLDYLFEDNNVNLIKLMVKECDYYIKKVAFLIALDKKANSVVDTVLPFIKKEEYDLFFMHSIKSNNFHSINGILNLGYNITYNKSSEIIKNIMIYGDLQMIRELLPLTDHRSFDFLNDFIYKVNFSKIDEAREIIKYINMDFNIIKFKIKQGCDSKVSKIGIELIDDYLFNNNLKEELKDGLSDAKNKQKRKI